MVTHTKVSVRPQKSLPRALRISLASGLSRASMQDAHDPTRYPRATPLAPASEVLYSNSLPAEPALKCPTGPDEPRELLRLGQDVGGHVPSEDATRSYPSVRGRAVFRSGLSWRRRADSQEETETKYPSALHWMTAGYSVKSRVGPTSGYWQDTQSSRRCGYAPRLDASSSSKPAARSKE